MTIMLSFGRWGGIYFYHDFTWRLCLGWIAVTIVPLDDDWFIDLLEVEDA